MDVKKRIKTSIFGEGFFRTPQEGRGDAKNALVGSMKHRANPSHLETLCIQNDKKLSRNVDVQDVGCYLIIIMT